MQTDSQRQQSSWSEEQVATALNAAKTKMQRLRARLHEPLAIIGVGCRFPHAQDPQAFWTMLHEGNCPIADTPSDRWSDALLAAEDKQKGKITANEGAFLDAVDKWDASFFGISRREAVSLDPQHRLMMTVAWEALEHAGIAPDQLRGARTGVFVGMCSSDYLHQLTNRDRRQIDAYLGTGNAHGAAVGRLSYFLNWQGPSLAIDTACSSSLTAVHFAARSLRARDCDMAMVGGVNLILAPELSINLSQAGMLSPTGRCHTFSSEADGFVRGEGCGVVLLKRLSDAQSDGDRILCVIRGSAVNQDGRSNGLTAPNGLSQQAVIRSALADAQLEPHDIDYIEAHGTGTALGDPIEMGALQAIFEPERKSDTPLQIGSVKTNIGHLEGAAGIAGLIKVCLSLEQGSIPPHLHFEHPSPHIDWNWPLQIPTALTHWSPGQRPRRAGVSSFGFGGTNAHVIVEEAPRVPSAEEPAGPQPLLVLSAKTATGLTAQAEQFAQAITEIPTRDLAYTAAVGRTHFAHRLALPLEDQQQAHQQLTQFAAGQETGPELLHGEAPHKWNLAMVFGGQGPHAVGVGRALYEHDPTFRQLLDEAAEAARQYWPRDVRTVLWEDATLWDQVDIQPATFCLQISLARLWTHYGAAPHVVLGHSLGEYAAACLAGIFSLSDALRLVCARARLMGDLDTPGRMLAVLAPHQSVRPLLPELPGLDIAAINGPRQTVVAGPVDEIEQLQATLQQQQIRAQLLGTTHAFHSPLVEPILEAFGQEAAQVHYSAPQCRLVSGMLGARAIGEVAQAAYWQQHLRNTVCFHQAAECLLADKPTAVLEVGIGSTLVGLIKSAFRGDGTPLLKGLSPGDHQWQELLQRLGQLYVLGASLDWSAIWARPGRKVALPTYPFETQRYWFSRSTTAPAAVHDSGAPGTQVHPLLGRRLELATRELVYETQLSADSYLQDHRLGDRVVFPATGYLELALAAGQDAGFKLLDVCQLKIRRPLELPASDTSSVQVVLTPQEESSFECRVLSRQDDGSWQLHASCELQAAAEAPASESLPVPEGAEVLSVAEHYARCRQMGLHYGPAFQGLRRLWRGDAQAWGQVELPRDVEPDGYLMHPALLDACLQITAGALQLQQAAAWLPVRVKQYRLERPIAPEETLNISVRKEEGARERNLAVTIQGTDAEGRQAFVIDSLRLRRVEIAASTPPPAATGQESPAAPPAGENLAAELLELSDSDREPRVLQLVRNRVAEILESTIDEVPVDQPLDTLGLDSLMAYELREEIKQSMRIDVSLEVFLQDVTLADLSVMLTDQFTSQVNKDGLSDDMLSPSKGNNEGLIEGAI